MEVHIFTRTLLYFNKNLRCLSAASWSQDDSDDTFNITFLNWSFFRLISIDPSKPLPQEQGDEHKIDHIQQLQPTVSLNDTKQETLSTEFSHILSDHLIIETTTSVFDEKDHVDRNDVEVSDSIEDDQKQTLSYPNETLEKGQEPEESETVEKSPSGGNWMDNWV